MKISSHQEIQNWNVTFDHNKLEVEKKTFEKENITHIKHASNKFSVLESKSKARGRGGAPRGQCV